MKIFDHDYDEIKNYVSAWDHSGLLSQRSDDGWELVSTIIVKIGSSEMLRLYWKREVKP
jgi:hypothetical protein